MILNRMFEIGEEVWERHKMARIKREIVLISRIRLNDKSRTDMFAQG